jgi:hypothetical protein
MQQGILIQLKDNLILVNDDEIYPILFYYNNIAVIAQSPQIKLSKELADELGWVDVEELTEHSSEVQEGTYTPQHKITYKHGYLDGFNKSQELRGFSLRDMGKCWAEAIIHFTQCRSNYTEFINSLKQPKQIKVTYTEENGVFNVSKLI